MPEQRRICFQSDVRQCVHVLNPLDVLDRTHDQGNSLMETVGYDVENPLSPGGGATARLLDDESHGMRFIDQAQAPFFVAVATIPGVEENTAANENAESFRDQGADPAHVEVLAARTLSPHDAFFDVGAHR